MAKAVNAITGIAAKRGSFLLYGTRSSAERAEWHPGLDQALMIPEVAGLVRLF